MNITLRDLLRWRESALYTSTIPAGDGQGGAAELLHPERAISWPVTMRATPPMLPYIDEGAIVLLPATTLAEVRPMLPGALGELRRRGVAVLVIDPEETLGDVAGDLDVVRAHGGVSHDLELLLTRVLNERRARLYRRGIEIDRALTEATLRGQGAARLLRIGAAQSGRTILLLDERGRVKEAAGPAGPLAPAAVPPPPAPPLGVDAAPAPITGPGREHEWLLAPLDGDVGGWLALHGPYGTLDEADRLLLGRVAAATALATDRRGAARLAPARRAALVADLLRPDLPPDERATLIETLGLDPAAAYAVLLLGTTGEDDDGRVVEGLRRSLRGRVAPYVEADDFAHEPSRTAGLLLHAKGGEALARAALALRGGIAGQHGPPPSGTRVVAALSAPVGLDRLPEAGRQAQYALALARSGAVAGPLVDWEVTDDLGPHRLLYPLWGGPEAARFVADVLGELPAYDARHGGDLLATLLAYLRLGGAAGSAAEQLGVHRNTLTYRLRRIEELAGRSPLDPDQQLSLHLAALLHALPSPDEA